MKFQDSDISVLAQNVVMALKRIVWEDLSYLQRRELVRVMIERAALSIAENNHLILKAFAAAWRYREMYEHGGDIIPVKPKELLVEYKNLLKKCIDSMK